MKAHPDCDRLAPFPTLKAAHLPCRPDAPKWLVESLWAEQAVGILGGAPKCAKSFLALHLAVAVASATPCLGRFAVTQPGPVLMFAAEDSTSIVRQRLQAIALNAQIRFEKLDIHLIDTPMIRLDDFDDQCRLAITALQLQPRLLILDPLVRMHGRDENAAAEIAPLLAHLRLLQKARKMAVLVVHHARKSSASRPGVTLRGSSDLHAWGDSNLYLRRSGKTNIVLSVEHRAALSINELQLKLTPKHDSAILQLDTTPPPQPPANPQQRIENALRQASRPLSQRELRQQAKTRATTVSQVLHQLLQSGRVTHSKNGYRLNTNAAN